MDLRNTLKRWSSGRVPPLTIAIILAAAALRFYGLAKQPLWYDELNGIEIATYAGGLKSMWHVPFYPHPPLFNMLLHFVFKIFDPSALSARILSVCAGLLAFPLFYRYATDVANKQIALIGMLLLAFSPLHIYFSQEGRPYSLLFALVILTAWLLHKALKENRAGWWVAHAACILALLYLHYFSWCIVGGEVVYVLLYWRKYKRRLAPFFLSLAVAPLALPPLINWIQDAQSIDKVTTVTNIVPISVSFSSTWMTLAAGEPWYVGQAFRTSAVLVFGVLALLGCVRLAKPKPSLLVLILSMFAVPFAFVFVLLRAMGEIVPPYQAKQFILILPFALILAASGIEYLCTAPKSSRAKTAGLVAAAILALIFLGGNALSLRYYYSSYEKNLDIHWIEYLESQVEPGDMAIISGMGIAMNMKYHWSADVPIESVAWPHRTEGEWLFSEELSSVPEEPLRWAVSLEDILLNRRVWLVTQDSFSSPQLIDDIESLVLPVSVERIGPFTVYLFVP